MQKTDQGLWYLPSFSSTSVLWPPPPILCSFFHEFRGLKFRASCFQSKLLLPGEHLRASEQAHPQASFFPLDFIREIPKGTAPRVLRCFKDTRQAILTLCCSACPLHVPCSHASLASQLLCTLEYKGQKVDVDTRLLSRMAARVVLSPQEKRSLEHWPGTGGTGSQTPTPRS